MLEEKLGELAGGKMLDMATGDGGFIRKLIDAFRDYDEVIAIDISDKHFEEARKDFEKDRVDFRKMDGASLPYADDSFDTVAMSAGLHHLPDIMSILFEMKRVLKPGGFFIVREMFCDHQSEKQLSDVYLHHWAAKISRIEGESHNPTLKKQEIQELIDSLGLKEYETGEYICRDCDPEKDGKMERELADIDKDLVKVEGHPQYDSLKDEGEQIRQRILKNGFACATNLDVIGIK
jgi:ubiquinone/menaquinone biosynthesis C-methylase UbiE